MKKIFTAIFLAMVLVVGSLYSPIEKGTVYAVESGRPSQSDWTAWVPTNGETMMARYNGTATEVVIPSEIGEAVVVSLDKDMFPQNVRKNLISVTFPETVKRISGVLSGASSLTDVTIPEGVEALEGTFRDCSSIAEITLPGSLKEIGGSAFYGCTSLQSITIPERVETIGQNAFLGCNALEEIEIPAGVTAIGGSAFGGCENLKSILVDEQNPSYVSVGGVLYSKDMSRLVCWPAGKEYTGISEQVTSIGDGAFYGCTFENITLPNQITELGKDAFSDCKNLKNIVLSDHLVSIGNSAFGDCESLEEISVPDTVTEMGKYVFSGCGSLFRAKLPKSLEKIEYDMFLNCQNLYEVVLPENLKEIGGQAFLWCGNLAGVEIPDGVTKIDISAFAGCRSLSGMKLPKSLQTMGGGGLQDCNLLHAIIIPEGTTTLGQFTFWGWNNRQYVVIPKSVTEFDAPKESSKGFWDSSEAVYCCYAGSPAEQFAIEKGIPYELIGETYHVYENYIYTIKDDDTVEITAYACDSKKMVIPDEIDGRKVTGILPSRRINHYVSSVTIPEGMTAIGQQFMFYLNLSEIIIPESVAEIDENAFKGVLEEGYDLPLTIKGVAGSYAQTYAEEHNIAWEEYVPEDPKDPEQSTDPENPKNPEQSTDPENPKDPEQSADPENPKDPEQSTDPENPKDPEPHIHAYAGEVTKEPTCTERGQKTYTCSCGKKYSDEISVLGHKYEEIRTPATMSKDGTVQKVCSVCSDTRNGDTIYRVKKVSLNKTDYICNGKVKSPSVLVKDSKGNQLAAGSDYDISYSAGRKDPGVYTVSIKFKGDYSGEVQKTFTIRPKSTGLGKITAKSKGFQATWREQAAQTSGYQIQCCIGGNFTGKTVKTVNIKKNTTVKKKVSGLKAKKKYYIRIRTYKTVKVNGKNKKLYSDWSNTKTVRTK